MKQSPIRKLRRDRTRLQQDLVLSKAGGDTPQIAIIEKKIRDLDKEIAAIEKAREAGG
jgi:uncharacterized protein involved in exopolysaccharide biosynthesis